MRPKSVSADERWDEQMKLLGALSQALAAFVCAIISANLRCRF